MRAWEISAVLAARLASSSPLTRARILVAVYHGALCGMALGFVRGMKLQPAHCEQAQRGDAGAGSGVRPNCRAPESGDVRSRATAAVARSALAASRTPAYAPPFGTAPGRGRWVVSRTRHAAADARACARACACAPLGRAHERVCVCESACVCVHGVHGPPPGRQRQPKMHRARPSRQDRAPASAMRQPTGRYAPRRYTHAHTRSTDSTGACRPPCRPSGTHGSAAGRTKRCLCADQPHRDACNAIGPAPTRHGPASPAPRQAAA